MSGNLKLVLQQELSLITPELSGLHHERCNGAGAGPRGASEIQAFGKRYLQHFISKQEALHPLVATLDLAKPGQLRLEALLA